MESLVTIQTPHVLPHLPAIAGPFEIRKATTRDISALLTLINDYAAKGIMLPRTEFEMAENIRDFAVAFSGRDLIACGALPFPESERWRGQARGLCSRGGRPGSGFRRRRDCRSGAHHKR